MTESRGSWARPVPLAAGAAIALLVPLLYPLLTGRVFTKDDLAALHLPFRYLYQQSLQAGEFLLWTPAYHAGFYLHGAGEAAMAHPLHLLLYRWLPLGVAFNIEIICSYVFLFAGATLFLRALSLSTAAALFGAMLAAFCGFTIYNLMHVNHIATLAHAPWLLWACHGMLTGRMRVSRALPLAALVTGSQLLSGNPQYVWITLVAAVFLCACLWRMERWPRLLWLVVAAVLGGMLGAVQLLPAIEFFGDSVRTQFTAEQAMSFSLSPLNLVQLWAPFAFESRVHAPASEALIVHEFIVYNGAFCTLALAWVVMRRQELAHRRLAALSLVFAALALWLAFGRHGGLYSLLAQVPGLSGIRAPARHVVLFQFALACLAAIVFEDMVALIGRGERVAPRRLWPLGVPVALAVVSIATAATLSGSSWAASHELRLSTLMRSLPWSLPLAVTAGLMALAARGRAVALPLLVTVAVVDLGAWGYSYAYSYAPLRSVEALRAEAKVPALAQPGDMIPTVEGGQDSLAILRGLRLMTGYTGLYPRSALEPTRHETMRLHGLQWQGDGDRWQPLADALPRVRLLAKAVVADVGALDLETTASVDAPIDLNGAAGSAHLKRDRPGTIEVETLSEGRQLLVLTERFHRGWRVQIDGQPAQTMSVYQDFLGCVVDSGRHHVQFEFAPRSFWLGYYITFTALVLTLLLGVILNRRERATSVA